MLSRCLLLCTLVLLSSPLKAETFHFASDIWRPLFYLDGNGKPRGISVEILTEAMKPLGHDVAFSYFPNRRLRETFLTGDFDGVMLDAPDWISPQESGLSLFSIPLLKVSEHAYMSARNSRMFNAVDEFKGLRIGVAAGYQYPDFEPLFERMEIRKFELENPNALSALVTRGRIDGFFMDDFLFRYLVNRGEILPEEFADVYEISNIDLSYRFHIKMRPHLEEINAMLRSMLEAGRIDEIVENYLTASE